jgi:GAF domain-containing protein
MVVPLCARGTILGVSLLARHQNPDPFGEDDLVLAEEIAARAAMAVDNTAATPESGCRAEPSSSRPLIRRTSATPC